MVIKGARRKWLIAGGRRANGHDGGGSKANPAGRGEIIGGLEKTPDRAGNVGPEWIYNFHAMNWNF